MCSEPRELRPFISKCPLQYNLSSSPYDDPNYNYTITTTQLTLSLLSYSNPLRLEIKLRFCAKVDLLFCEGIKDPDGIITVLPTLGLGETEILLTVWIIRMG